MIILENDFEQSYYDRTSDFLNLAIEYGEIINQYQDKNYLHKLLNILLITIFNLSKIIKMSLKN